MPKDMTIIATGDEAQAVASEILGEQFVAAHPVVRIERQLTPESEQVYGSLRLGDKFIFEFTKETDEQRQFVVVDNED